MKTIRIILILGTLVVACHSFGQTKEETVKWLTEKMLKECFWATTGDLWINQTTKIDFDDNYLSFTVTTTAKRDVPNFTTKGYTFFRNYRVDLSKLDTDAILRASIRTNGNNILMGFNNEQNRYQERYESSLWFTEMNSSCEPDIFERFKKAMEHYISLMAIKKSTETF